MLAIKGGTVITVDREEIKGGTVLVDNGKIVAVGQRPGRAQRGHRSSTPPASRSCPA